MKRTNEVLDCVALLAAMMASVTAFAGVEWWAVPAMSEEQRLPDTVPTDGEKGGTVAIVAARDEYEPGSFVIRADRDLGKVRLELGDLKRVEEKDSTVHQHLPPTSTFPKENLDLKVVKVWYQNKNGWFSYFADTGFKLLPELLLNDEDLIRVDEQKVANYARLTEKDGRVHEWWINPPRLMDRREFDHYVGSCAFQSMRGNFQDAKTLQPVTLAKGKAKQFFLTAHVTKDIPAGLYKGEVKVVGEVKVEGVGVQRKDSSSSTPTPTTYTYCSIPVALRVLDFTLPKPMAYRHPDREYLVASYNYSSPGHISQWDGGEGRSWELFEEVLKDQVRHGQTIHWMFGACAGANGTERTIDAMKRAGMRSDLFVGGISCFGEWYTTDPQMYPVSARFQSDYYDRVHGHHNVYMGYGDESGFGTLKKQRVVFEPFHDYGGTKFILAAQNSIRWKCGYLFDWHNTAGDANVKDIPDTWNDLGGDCYCGCYSKDHVGTENPAFNRRSYGLCAYLSGYSATCNYAHHYGPYNDDTDTYKPMVFAYGTGGGVIDTLQWEGFREGIDDIRYATLLGALARAVEATDSVDLRRLAGKAKLYLAALQRSSDDLNMARGEMIRFIEELRAALGPKADVKIVARKEVPTAKKPLPKLDPPKEIAVTSVGAARKMSDEWLKRNEATKAAQVYLDFIAKSKSAPQVHEAVNALAAFYWKTYQHEKAIDILIKHNHRLEAAERIAGRNTEADARARKMREEVFLDEKETTGNRVAAWRALFGSEFAEKNRDAYLKLCKPKDAADWFLRPLTIQYGNYAFRGNWQHARKALAWADLAEGTNAAFRAWSCKAATYAAQICNAAGDKSAALDYLNRGYRTCQEAAAKGGKAAWKPEDVYHLEMFRVVLNAKGDVRGMSRAIIAADGVYGRGVPPTSRKDRLERIGSAMMCAGDETRVRALDASLKEMIRPFDSRTYAMRYSPVPVRGLAGWKAAAAWACPDIAKLDRPYGGNSLDFFETDVRSGDRGSAEKDLSKTYQRAPQWQAMFDDWGVHFRLEVFDEKAREIGAGFASAGSLEGYIAAGENVPYTCFLHNFREAGLTISDTMYDQPGYRRIDPKNSLACRSEVAATDDSVVLYWAFSWDNYATRIPTDGALWEFEQCLWGRKASCTWNGLKTIHGRSSWGKLRFEMSEKARTAVLRQVLIRARARYNREKVSPSNLPEGVIEHWSDPAVGDLQFYDSILKPIVEELDAASKRVVIDMDAATVNELEKTALPKWHDFRFLADRLRAEYLKAKSVRQDFQPLGVGDVEHVGRKM